MTFLGTGTSTGVPVFGCDCPVCTSDDPRNHRTRPSVLFSFPEGNLLVDTSPEMRLQLLRERVRGVHAIAYTHHHADHLFGLDDARLFPRSLGGPVPIFCDEQTALGHGLGARTMPETRRYSTVCALHTFWLAARAQGLGVGWVSILDPATLAQTLDTPRDWTFIAYLCVGWPEEEHLDPELARSGWQAREAHPVLRR